VRNTAPFSKVLANHRLAQSIHIVQELGDIVGLLTWDETSLSEELYALTEGGSVPVTSNAQQHHAPSLASG
jgi:hypothetical protein